MNTSFSDIRKRLILGVGNDVLMDDGIGPRIVNDLQRDLPSDHFTCYQTINLGGLEILEFIRNYDEVVIIDAIKTAGGTPGDVYILTPGDFKETCHLSSFHDVSFLTALKLGDKLQYKLPEIIVIIAVEIVEDLCFGEHFSPLVQQRFEDSYIEIKSFIESFVNRCTPLAELLNYTIEYGK
ncbi:MAG TPA: hydrogenase maturation protease [Bacteroidales bacterium]|nr:hydrogenase maturation protease [Bacteroidales bacterium]